MKTAIKRISAIALIFTMMLSAVGCSLFDSKEKVYTRYLTSILDINYKNITKDYITLNGVSQKDAEAVYVANMDHQAHNLMNYYGIKEVDDGTVLSEFYYLAQTIFANAKYDVTDVKHDKSSDTYTLEVTVYPLDTLETTHEEIVAYIENFNARVDEGEFNNTNEVDYETEFAEGIIEILKKTADKPGYMDPVVINVPIQTKDDYYCISDEDFLEINSNILYFVTESPKKESAEETTEEATEATTVDPYAEDEDTEAPVEEEAVVE